MPKDGISFAASTLLGAFLAFGLPCSSHAQTVVDGAGGPRAAALPSVTAQDTTAGPVGEDAVLLYCGNGGNCSEGLTDLTNHYVSLGAGVDLLLTLPPDLSPYRLVFVILPNVPFDPAQVGTLDAFVRGGGRLVLVSDFRGFYFGHSVLNGLLANLAVPIRVDASSGVDIGCRRFTSNIVDDQITEGVSSFEYAFTDTVTVSGDARVLIFTQGAPGQPMVAVGQSPGVPARPGADVVVAGDSNSFTDLCAPVANPTFWTNLYDFPPRCFAIDAIDDQPSVINDGSTADIFVLENDECNSDTPISVIELPGDLLPDRGGSATIDIDGTALNYTPAAGFVGFEEFTYTAQDAGLDGGDDPPAVDQDTATVAVNVLEDITPEAVDDVATALGNQFTIIDVLGNDPLGNAPNAVAIETAPANGSATVQLDDTIRYISNFGFFGADSFEYRLTDANGDSDVATVTVCVLSSGQLPIDIMPSDPGNNLNLRAGSGASISVAVLSASEICAAPILIDPLTLEFGPGQAGISGNPRARDVDGDGDKDLVVKFLTNETGIACGDTEASLSGSTFDFQSISGMDTINTFNCPRIRKRH
jgi:hypothetical protein